MVQTIDFEQYIANMNDDIERRSNNLPTKPFAKQAQTALMFPKVAINNSEGFYASENYYPEETRNNLDIENKTVLLETIKEIQNTKQVSMQKAA
ncbi:MAG: hypothetical protein IJ093_02590 [Bacilli bacterium]|nr:hypothetical protein [Bacilli bacterium]